MLGGGIFQNARSFRKLKFVGKLEVLRWMGKVNSSIMNFARLFSKNDSSVDSRYTAV